MRIRDWSSDVCSSDLVLAGCAERTMHLVGEQVALEPDPSRRLGRGRNIAAGVDKVGCLRRLHMAAEDRSEEHTSELQSLMRISYAVFCLKKNTKPIRHVDKCEHTNKQHSTHPTPIRTTDTSLHHEI